MNPFLPFSFLRCVFGSREKGGKKKKMKEKKERKGKQNSFVCLDNGNFLRKNKKEKEGERESDQERGERRELRENRIT